MPRGQDRQVNAQNKALETIIGVATIDPDEEKEPVAQSATVVNHPAAENNEEKSTPRKKVQANETQAQPETRFRKPSEDFFDYINRVAPEDWSNSQTSGIYLYKRSPKGNVRITDEPLKCPITLQELREEYLPVHGDGTYRLQFTTGLKYLTNCGENVTFDGETASLGGTSTGFLKRPSVSNVDSGFTDAIKATSEMLKDGAKAAVEVSKLQQTENNKGIDIAGIITAIAALNNHKDGDSALVKMLEAQKADADKRADREKADAEARVQREVTAANERQTRDQQFFQMIMKQNEDRAADKDKFFEILLKEKDKKEDSFGMGDVLKELFKAFAQERLEGGGDTTLPGWAGVVQTALPKVADAVSTFMAVRAGASPQQIQQLQAAQNQNSETQHGPNGGISNPVRIPPIVSADQQLIKFVNWLGEYLSTHAEPRLDHVLDVIAEEYGPIQDWIIRSTPEQVFEFLNGHQLGQQLLSLAGAPEFISQAITQIKSEQSEQDQEPPIIPATAQQYSVEGPSKPKKRKQAAN